jgi:lipopolysaccharide transport system ATP-binding protein
MSFNQRETASGMGDIAINVQGVSKCYQIYSAPRDRLKQFLMPRARRILGMPPVNYYREFWAVSDVSFEVGKGETVGIIGRNGSGKSTLLQIICGTLALSSGSVEVDGRVAALLELGSGFNPEFTGRENVYLNGAVFGLSKDEIDARLGDILDFADIGDFIDQPVKTYSSGMFVRLAFSVAMHVEPQILIVDEALSVGDAFFQSKCATAMKGLMAKGATVLLVSHDMHAVKSMCTRAVLMESGRMVAYGDPGQIVERYYSSRVGGTPTPEVVARYDAPSGEDLGDVAAFEKKAAYQRIRNGKARFINVMLLDEQGRPAPMVEFRQKVVLRMIVEAEQDMDELGFAYHIRDMKGVELVYSDTGIDSTSHLSGLDAGRRYVIDWAFEMALREGEYNFAVMASVPIDIKIGEVEVCEFVPYALQFRVIRGRANPIYAAVHWPNHVVMKAIR